MKLSTGSYSGELYWSKKLRRVVSDVIFFQFAGSFIFYIMSTKSLDLNLYLYQLGINNEATSSKLSKEMKPKMDASKLHAYEEIGARLIEDGLLLTALELYAELAEVGHEILCLKHFFSNPGNFEKTATTEVNKLMGNDCFY